MLRRHHLFLLAALGCGTNTEIEPQLTITQGLYGQLTQSCTQPAGCVGAPREGTPVAWFATSPFSNTDAGVKPMPLKETTSGKNGFYEFAIDSNESGYLALGRPEATQGTVWFTATSTRVPRGLGRLDWHASSDNAGVWNDVK